MTKNAVIPKGLIHADEHKITQKIARFAADNGVSNLHVVIDFDRTMTMPKSKTVSDATTWHIMREHLPDEGVKRYDKLFATYRPLEVSSSMTEADAATWWMSILNLFIEYEVNMQTIEDDFVKRASIRPGTLELFKLCNRFNIPTVILSAGVREIIDVWCKVYSIEPTLIVSTKLKVEASGYISGWEHDTLVHALNKAEADHPELTNIRSNRRNAIVLGDGIDDADMATGDDAVIRVRVLDLREDDMTSVDQVRQMTFSRFDAIIESGSIQPVCDLVQLIADPTEK